MIDTIAALGAWSWMIAAAVLFVLELVAPGIFLMWFGVAAAKRPEVFDVRRCETKVA